MALLSEPTDTTVILIGLFLVFKQAMMNCSRSNPYSCSLIMSYASLGDKI